jgi:hypothetical protein
MTDPRESKENLWLLPASPAIWAAHFLTSYATAALWCGKLAGAGDSLTPVRAVLALYTLVALAAIAVVGWRGYLRHRYGDAPPPHDDDSAEDRHRFIGFSTLLLSGLSIVAILYTSLAAVFFRSCA